MKETSKEREKERKKERINGNILVTVFVCCQKKKEFEKKEKFYICKILYVHYVMC